MHTYFAPAKKTDRRKFKNQIYDISHSPIMDTLLQTMAGLMVVLNEDRQIITLNHAFLEAIGIKNAEEVLGLRLGQTLNCIHAEEEPYGCGTTPYCSTCGAAIAQMAAIKDDRPDEKVCVLTTKKEGDIKDICLLVRAQPITLEGNRWILVFAQDITQQQFWTNIERVFFHDINNMLTALSGLSKILSVQMPENTVVRQINEVTGRLCNEINVQNSLSQYKDVQYFLRKTSSSINDIRKELEIFLKGNRLFEERNIIQAWPNEEINIYTDILLVSRIIGNMIINALEASEDRGTIKVSARIEVNEIVWDVWNSDCIPINIQNRIFQRHFSTKASVGRGLGTFSMKLFGEKYLKGKVSFLSSVEKGTTFTFKLPRH